MCLGGEECCVVNNVPDDVSIATRGDCAFSGNVCPVMDDSE